MTGPAQPIPYDTDIAQAAALIADPTRAAMLRALVGGRPLAAGELARLAGVSAATASFHLAKLCEGNLIEVDRQGRHRYYRLAGHEVAAALEALGPISPALPVRTLRQSRGPPRSPRPAPATTTWRAGPGWGSWRPWSGTASWSGKNKNLCPERAVVRAPPPRVSKPRGPERRRLPRSG